MTACAPFDNFMVIYLMGYSPTAQSKRLDAVFAALADPTRRAILNRLASGEASVNELARPFEMSQPAISKHLRVLERAGLISRGRDAQRRPCRLEPERLAEADHWLENYRRLWEERFARLDALLEEMQAAVKPAPSDGKPVPASKEQDRKRVATRSRRARAARKA